LNCNGLSVENAVSAFFESSPTPNLSDNNDNNHNHNRMQTDSLSLSDSDSPNNQSKRSISTRSMSRSQSVSTSLHNQPMNGPLFANDKGSDFEWNCDNESCSKHSECKRYKIGFYECSEVGDQVQDDQGDEVEKESGHWTLRMNPNRYSQRQKRGKLTK